WRILLLEAVFVLLIDDDQTQLACRREHRAAGADHDLGLSRKDPPPMPAALGRLQMAVQYRHVLAAAAKTLDGLRRQADLGHQNERFLALANDLLNSAKIKLGLAAAGNAEEQERLEAAFAQSQLQD